MASHFLQKKQVVFFFEENGLFVIALIVNVINAVGFIRHNFDYYLGRKFVQNSPCILKMQGEFWTNFLPDFTTNFDKIIFYIKTKSNIIV